MTIIEAHAAAPVPHSIATFITGGGTPADLGPDVRRELVDLLRENGGITVDFEREDSEDTISLLEAIAHPDPARPWRHQWDLELMCLPLLRSTVEDMLSLELL